MPGSRKDCESVQSFFFTLVLRPCRCLAMGISGILLFYRTMPHLAGSEQETPVNKSLPVCNDFSLAFSYDGESCMEKEAFVMHKSAKKGLAALMAATVLTAPLAMSPMAAYALSVDDVSADNTDTDEETEYTIEFEIEKDLKRGDTITVSFPSGYSLKKVRESDVTLKDDDKSKVDIDKVDVGSREIKITVDEKIKADTGLILYIDRVVNPSKKGDYAIKVKTNRESYDDEDITIGKSSSSKGSSKDFDVSQGNYEEGATTSITLGKFSLSKSDKLKKGKYIYVDFPDKDMLPKKIDNSDVKVNGSKADDVRITDSDSIRIEIPKGQTVTTISSWSFPLRLKSETRPPQAASTRTRFLTTTGIMSPKPLK